jgi:hypothetical protein
LAVREEARWKYSATESFSYRLIQTPLLTQPLVSHVTLYKWLNLS